VNVRRQEMRCVVCTRSAILEFATNPEPECPEFIRPVSGEVRWIAPVDDARDGRVRMVMVCSDACLHRITPSGPGPVLQ
jgi:hypothetical protein